MSSPLKNSAYLYIVNRARTHVLKGGGVMPDENGDHEDSISVIASLHFGGRAAEADVEGALKGLEPEKRQEILDAVWMLVAAHQDSGFTFGCAVGLQLRQVAPLAGTVVTGMLEEARS
jgi:hypothetical protein